jgi:hypothetical protein
MVAPLWIKFAGWIAVSGVLQNWLDLKTGPEHRILPAKSAFTKGGFGGISRADQNLRCSPFTREGKSLACQGPFIFATHR